MKKLFVFLMVSVFLGPLVLPLTALAERDFESLGDEVEYINAELARIDASISSTWGDSMGKVVRRELEPKAKELRARLAEIAQQVFREGRQLNPSNYLLIGQHNWTGGVPGDFSHQTYRRVLVYGEHDGAVVVAAPRGNPDIVTTYKHLIDLSSYNLGTEQKLVIARSIYGYKSEWEYKWTTSIVPLPANSGYPSGIDSIVVVSGQDGGTYVCNKKTDVFSATESQTKSKKVRFTFKEQVEEGVVVDELENEVGKRILLIGNGRGQRWYLPYSKDKAAEIYVIDEQNKMPGNKVYWLDEKTKQTGLRFDAGLVNYESGIVQKALSDIGSGEAFFLMNTGELIANSRIKTSLPAQTKAVTAIGDACAAAISRMGALIKKGRTPK